MAYNRPKSLDELNSIFDKTIAAEKAIKKNSSLLEKGEDSFASFWEYTGDEKEKVPMAQETPSEAITDSVSDFIAKFSAETEQEPVRAKPQMTVITPESAVRHEEKKNDFTLHETETVTAAPAEKLSRDELFDEYARIMSDDDEETSSEKKISRKEKKKKKKKKQKAEKKAAVKVDVAQEDVADASAEEEPVAEETVAEETFAEELATDAVVTEEFVAEEPVIEETVTQELVEESVTEEPVYDEVSVAENEVSEIEVSEEISDAENDEFSFPEDHVPEWMKEEEKYEEIEVPVVEKTKAVRIFLKALLGIILVAVISIGSFATAFKTVVAVNTGKLIADKYYVFTAYKDYPDIGLFEGDLVITEKKFAEEGEVFAYVDYSSRSFEFGKRTDSITKEDGEVLYVTEKDASRTLVSRDDCKGVLQNRFENYGKIVSYLTDNYIVVIAAAAITSLVIILVFALALKEKKKEDDETDESDEENLEETEEDVEDVFLSI